MLGLSLPTKAVSTTVGASNLREGGREAGGGNGGREPNARYYLLIGSNVTEIDSGAKAQTDASL